MASKYCDRVKSCKYSWWCANDYNPERNNHECFVPLTNADRIRAMSDEELAEWINGYGNSEAEWLDWLKIPVEDNE